MSERRLLKKATGVGIAALMLALPLSGCTVMANQELFTTVRYWEGAVDVSGQRDGKPISGRGYVELTGYAENE